MAECIAHSDVAIVGAGPAGLAAAIQLAELGVECVVLDEKPAAGGQLFKQIHKFFGSERHMAGVRGYEIGRRCLARCRELGVPIRLNCPVWGLFPGFRLGVTLDGGPVVVAARQVILATGATENALVFPGWTLPGVMGAGAAQTLVNYHRVRPGERAVVVGGGNVGLIVAYQLLQAGITVAAIVESAGNPGGYMVHGAKVRRMGVPIHVNHTVVSAAGEEQVERCVVARVDDNGQPVPGTEKTLPADLVCVAVGLSPAVELGAGLALPLCHAPALGGWVPIHDETLLTAVAGVYVTGDVSGVEEASSAMEEGRLAAVGAAAALGSVSKRTAAAMSAEIRRSVAALRRGPFGAAVAAAKARIHMEYAKQCRTNA